MSDLFNTVYDEFNADGGNILVVGGDILVMIILPVCQIVLSFSIKK